MTDNDIPRDLPTPEYTLRWKEKNLAHLRSVILEMQQMQRKPRKYKTYDTLLVANFLENLTITAEAIYLLSLKYFEAEIITLAGMMVEGMSLMLYCIKNNKAEYYIDFLTINGLALEYREAELGAPNPKQIEVYVNILEKFGNKYIKLGQNYTDVINFLKSEKNNYTGKIKILRESYKEFPKRKCTVQSMVDEFVEEKIMKVVYAKYCHVKHHHLNNNIQYPEFKYWKKEFSPYDELCAISTALVVSKEVLKKYKEMKEKGYIEEKY
ncbi:MAG: GLTP domain-containing protein [Endomicrobia bacterium]|nr:GLTP domain-containing protein [Endomicrobiia bacterium]